MEQSQQVHIQKIKKGLSILDKVFNRDEANYRVIGSIPVAALNGKPHRTLGDIDILIDAKDFETVLSKLESEGYTIKNYSKFGFSWREIEKPDSLGFTFLLIGKFGKDYFSYPLAKNVELRIAADYLTPTKYTLFGISFTGIPARSVYEGLKISNLNPKRKLDQEVVINKFNDKIPEGISISSAFKVYLFGKEIPFAYQFFSQIYNIFGGLRVLLGRKYEVWH